MATASKPDLQPGERDRLLNAWIDRMTDLVRTVEAWAIADDWATRTITKKMEDREVGDHRAPALLLQKETVRVILEPISREAVGGIEGVADLYLMPAYDDIVRLYFSDGWKVDYPSEMAARLGIADLESPKAFDQHAFRRIAGELSRDAS
ncbi:hypothetical protein TA3x_003510 [Tundrisphaera sp. TA3]|uniref:hypothetical protein n=1 Tax=Tundrisphaera sp. TA3 TaxID=3435775 RepID=UPI003EBA7CB8